MAAKEDDTRRRAEELFYQAAELPPEERRAFLDTHCSDAAVREEVELLLAQDARTEDPAARVVQFLSGADADAIKRGKGTTEYSVGREIGRGGMGVIYEVRDPGLRRTVAMKVMLGPPGGRHGEFKGELALESYRAIARLLKQAEGRPPLEEPGIQPAYDSLVRFLEEAEVTAQLDHPGIVPIHELGLDSEGQVYFTMRLVKGRTLDTVFELARNEIGVSLDVAKPNGWRAEIEALCAAPRRGAAGPCRPDSGSRISAPPASANRVRLSTVSSVRKGAPATMTARSGAGGSDACSSSR